jgi:hypothetical protein
LACGNTSTDLAAGGVKAYWNDSTDNVGVDHYEYISFNPADDAALPSLDSGHMVTNSVYSDKSFIPSVGTYGFMVRAVDAAGNKSGWTNASQTIADSCQITFNESTVLADSLTKID